MGLRINTLNQLAFAKLETAKRVQAKEVGVTNPLRSSDPVNLKRSSEESDLSRVVKSSQNVQSAGLKALDSSLGPLAQDFFSRLSREQIRREEALEGYGDRLPQGTNTPPDPRLLNEFNTEAIEIVDPEDTDIRYEGGITQENLNQLRETLSQFVSDHLILNSEATGFSLRAAVDETFGEGTSDLFNIRIQDLGAGRSQVEIDQIEESEIVSEEDRRALIGAILVNEGNFKVKEPKVAIEGEDVDASLETLRRIVGAKGQGFVEDLKRTRGNAEEFQSSVENLSSNLDNLQLSREQASAAASALANIENLLERAKTRFSRKPLLDDFSREFQSERAALAFSPSEVESSLKKILERKAEEEEYFQQLASSRT